MTTPSVVGIDLGTTFSLAAYVENGRPVVVRDAQRRCPRAQCHQLPRRRHRARRLAARDRALPTPSTPSSASSGSMGRTLADLEKELPTDPAPDRRARDGRRAEGAARDDRRPRVHAGRTLRDDPEGSPPARRQPDQGGHHRAGLLRRHAAPGHPRRRPHRRAGRAAHRQRADRRGPGLRARPAQASGTIAVYDLGGGTFDCSILSLADGVFKVLATNGDTYLGGDDFDRAIMKLVARGNRHRRSIAGIPELLQHLRDAAERTKIALSSAERANFAWICRREVGSSSGTSAYSRAQSSSR